LLWEINGNGLSSPSYLFGTFHLLCSDDIVFSKNLKQAIDNSREIYMELDMDDPATIFGGLMVMNMKDGKKLKDFYPEGIYKRITDYFKDSLQTPIGLFQNIKPAFLISMLYPKMMPCQTVSSVEDEIMKLAKENDSEKEIRGLETIVAQAAVFDSIPYENQAEELLKTIDSMEKSKAMFAVMLKAYKNQQLDEIEKLINDPGFGMEGNQDVLLDNRNKNWVDQLKEIMKTKPVFIAVGAGHLPGKTGLIELLRGAGFTVRPLENR
jgi:uncharacterized protein YbaP (TraB family)